MLHVGFPQFISFFLNKLQKATKNQTTLSKGIKLCNKNLHYINLKYKFQIFNIYIYNFIIKKFYIKKLNLFKDVKPTKKDTLKRITHNQIPKLKILFEKYIYAVHISLFYINGRYYEISKRMFNNRYVSKVYICIYAYNILHINVNISIFLIFF